MNNFLFRYFSLKIKEYTTGLKITDLFACQNGCFVLNIENDKSIIFKLSAKPAILIVNSQNLEKISNTLALNIKKKINRLKIEYVEYQGLERVLKITFLDKRLSIENRYNLIFEISGREGNLIFYDSQMKVIEAYKYTQRVLSKHLYEKPQKMLDLLINKEIAKKSIGKENILGIDTFLKKFINEKNIDSFIEMSNKISNEFYEYQYEGKTFYYPFWFDFGLDARKITLDELTKHFLILKTDPKKNNNQKAIKLLNKKIENLQLRIKKIEEDLENTKQADAMFTYAQALLSNVSSIKSYQERISLKDSITGELIEIELNPKKSVQANIDNYFKLYKKAKNSSGILLERLNQSRKEIEYFEELKAALENNAVDSIYVENLLKKNKPTIQTMSTKALPYEKLNIMGFDSYIGKNSKGNDYILKNASKDDIWLHPKNIPGPHLIIKNSRHLQKIDDSVIQEGAELIKQRLKNTSNIEVDYTFVKFVKKPKGFKSGRVIYSNYKTVVVK